MRFENKILLATGAASGLGAAVARRFTREGGRVALIDLHAERLEALAGELAGSLPIAADVSNEDAVQRAVAQAHAHFGRIDCVFNSAGFVDFAPIEEWTLERWNRLLGVHLGGTFLVCKNVLPLMRRQGGGVIVNVASIAAMIAQRNNAAYGAAKGAIIAFSRQLALEAAPLVRVNAIAPGGVLTGMTAPLWQARAGGDLAQGVATAGARSMMQRVADPDEIAGPACFLFSDEASFMTASVLVADGGETVV